MEKYIEQLCLEIAFSAANADAAFPGRNRSLKIENWITEEEEERTAPYRRLEDVTGIHHDQLPYEELLDKRQLAKLLEALKKMLDAYNWSFILQTEVPERIQYRALRDNFDQAIQLRQWHTGFFELCKKGTKHRACALGEHCQCEFYASLFLRSKNRRRRRR